MTHNSSRITGEPHAEPAGSYKLTDKHDRHCHPCPAQATAYKIGELRIRGLRQQAENELGERFDLRDFHDQVLANGSVPIAVLESLVREWIATENKYSMLEEKQEE